MQKIIINADFDESYELKDWVKENLQQLKETGLELINDTVEMVDSGFTVRNQILDQTFFIKCDKEKSSMSDLGLIIAICSQCNAQGVIWLANNISDELRYAFNWWKEIMGANFEAYLLEIEINTNC